MAAPKKRREAEKELKAKGFTQQPGRGKGSHQVWKDSKGNSVTVPTHGDEIAAGTWRSIERQANQAPRKQAQSDTQAAQRAAGSGVAAPGSKGRGSGQQGQGQQGQGQKGQKPAKKKRFGFGSR
ncbi:type II toxin-antitoxin system HicA family toxin [Kribbella sp. NPDC004536]|uniref:type II toxin-antitoxin system HicA family toxin n=1 Tax=Kribbella sp. NPDC004536 TaxID=3364106 RepID=UPI003697D818